MSVIVNVRGTNGSGKSTAVTRYMEVIRVEEELKQGGGKTWAYRLRNGVSVLGRYTTACGGCDTVKTFADLKAGVTELASFGPVLFEGVLWSTCFTPSVELAQSLPQHHFIFAMIDTSAVGMSATCAAPRRNRRHRKLRSSVLRSDQTATEVIVHADSADVRRLEAALDRYARRLPNANAFVASRLRNGLRGIAIRSIA